MKRLFSLDIPKIKDFIRHNTIALDYGGGLSFTGNEDFYYRINNGSWVKISANTYSTIVLFIKTYVDSGGVYHVSEMDISDGDTATRTIIQDIITAQRVDLMGEWDDIYFDNRFTKWFMKNMIIIDNPIEIELSYIDIPSNYLFKDTYDIISVFGALRDEIDVINPVILIETDSTITLTNKNYASFTILGKLRYYFIRNITCVRTNVYRLTLHQDSLKTFASLIQRTPVFVTRSEGDGGIDGLVDDRLPLYDEPKTTKEIVSHHGDKKDTNFESYEINQESIRNIAFISYGSLSVPDNKPYYSSPLGINPTQVSSIVGNLPKTNGYAINFTEFEDIVNTVIGTSSLAGNIMSCVYFPFHLNTKKDCKVDSLNDDIQTGQLYLGSTAVGSYTPPILKGYSSGYHVIADFTLNATFLPTLQTADRYKFLNHEPYSKIEMFIPYLGWITLNSIEVLNKRLLVYYVCDWITGLANVYVSRYPDNVIVYSSQIQLGIPLGLTKTNMEEITKQRQSNIANLMLGLIGSTASVGIGIATLNPVMIAGGAIGGFTSIMSTINKNAMMIDRMDIMTGGEKFGFYSGNLVVIKHTYREPRFAENSTADDVYKRLNGLPLITGDTIENFSSGYIECAGVELPFRETISGTTYTLLKDEYDEIVSLLKSGIVI